MTDIQLNSNDDLFNILKNDTFSNTETGTESCNTNSKSKLIIEYCTSCNSLNLNNIEGQIICSDCGTINDNIIDSNPEWRYYGSEDSKSSDPNRCGMPTNELLPQSYTGSTVSYKWGESFEMRKIRNYRGWNAMPIKKEVYIMYLILFKLMEKITESRHVLFTNKNII